MNIRLNKLISDSGICSRREADKYIEEGHVTVNGKQPHMGQRVNENDIVMFDDLQIKISKRTLEQARKGNSELEIEFDMPTQKTVKKEKVQNSSKEKEGVQNLKGTKVYVLVNMLNIINMLLLVMLLVKLKNEKENHNLKVLKV